MGGGRGQGGSRGVLGGRGQQGGRGSSRGQQGGTWRGALGGHWEGGTWRGVTCRGRGLGGRNYIIYYRFISNDKLLFFNVI